MSWTFLLAFVAFSLIFVWLLGVRYQVEVLQDAVGNQELEVSLAERWSEDADSSAPTSSARHRLRAEAHRELRRSPGTRSRW